VFFSVLGIMTLFNMPFFFLGAVAAGFFVAFLFNKQFRWIIFPVVLCFHYNLLKPWGILFQFGGLTILPADWLTLFLLGALFLRRALYPKPVFERNGLEKPAVILLAALTAVSFFGSAGIKGSIVGLGHIVLYFLFLYAMVADWKDVPVGNLWRSYEFWAFPAAISILLYFVSTGGERSLGIGSFWFPNIILPVIYFRLVEMTFKRGIWRLSVLGVWVLAILSSQTRGAWISLGVVTVTWFFIQSFLKEESVKKRLARVGLTLLKLSVFFILVFLFLGPYLGSTEKRAEQLVTGAGTIYLRYFLWSLAIKVFLLHPVAGVGLWQFQNVVEQLSVVKNIPVFHYVRGLTPHNMLLEVLAETGIIGAVALFIFYVAVLRRAWKVARLGRTQDEICFGWGLFLSLFYFAVGNLYTETWIGYHFMFFLALLMIFERQLKSAPMIEQRNKGLV